MIHQELRLVGSIVFWVSIIGAVLSVIASLLTATAELLLYGTLAAGSGYIWRVWLHSHAQRGEDLQEMLQLLRNEEKRQKTINRHERQTPPTTRVQASKPSNTETRKPAEGQAQPPREETSIIRDSLSRNKGNCAACGTHILMVRVGDTCASCGSLFTSETHHRQPNQS